MRKTASALGLCFVAACGSADKSSPGGGPGLSAAGGSASVPVIQPSAAPAGTASTPAAIANPAMTAQPNQPSSAPATQTPTMTTMPASSNPASPASSTPAQMPANMPAAMNPMGTTQLAMDECGLKTKYAGDQYCIKPPPADKGFQIHIGPTDYNNPEAKYLLQPGEENVVTMTAVSGNDKDILYYYRQYRMRPGSHHVIMAVAGRRIGGVQNLARDEPNNGMIAPEDQDVGLSLKAHTTMDINMHFYNFSDKPMLRELWLNYWYKDAASVKEPSIPIYSFASVSPAVAHSHVVVGAICPVSGNGRVLNLYGHRHLNNVRFSIWHNSGSKHDLVFDDYDSEHPGALDYNSLTMNPAPNPMAKALGGSSGMLELKQGDSLEFECEIVNNTDKNFFGANEAKDDEMCIMIGDAVGSQVSAACTAKAAKRVN